MKEAVTKHIDTLTQGDFHGAFQKLLERYNKCIAVGGDYFEGDQSFMCVLSIKMPIWKKSANLSYAPRIITWRLQSFSFPLIHYQALLYYLKYRYKIVLYTIEYIDYSAYIPTGLLKLGLCNKIFWPIYSPPFSKKCMATIGLQKCLSISVFISWLERYNMTDY